MRVHIHTEYLGRNRYRITVRQEGRTVDTILATCGTVVWARNEACAGWANQASEVIAEAIPDAWDMAPHKRKQ